MLTTGMIAQSIEQRQLHLGRIPNQTVEGPDVAMPREVYLPVVNIKLSAIFLKMVSVVVAKDSARSNLASSVGELGDFSDTQSPSRPIGAISMSSKQPWAYDVMSVDFKGVQGAPRTVDTGDDAATSSRLTCVSVATISVRKPARLATLSGRVDRDVSYNLSKGEFYVVIRHPIGEPTLPQLKSRIMAIDRFVSFLDALDKAKGTITKEAATLKGVTCHYEPKISQVLDGEVGADPQRWRVILDLSQPEIDVKLDKGNPHLRVLDLIKRVVNLDGGIRTLMAWLPESLPTMSTIDKIETIWEDIEAKNQGEVVFSMKALDWMGIRYTLRGADATGQQVEARLDLECRIKDRKGELWWHVFRNHKGPDEDVFSNALRPILEGKGDGWQGLLTGATGKVSGGAARLFLVIDEAIRGIIENDDWTSSQFTSQSQSQKLGRQATHPTVQQGHAQNGKRPDQAIEIA
jgi:mediator of RNA polymerase II transcription subunit 14